MNTKHLPDLVQCWTNVKDVGSVLYKCYKNVLCLLGWNAVQYRSGHRGHVLMTYRILRMYVCMYVCVCVCVGGGGGGVGSEAAIKLSGGGGAEVGLIMNKLPPLSGNYTAQKIFLL